MLFSDWNLVLNGEHIRITPIVMDDVENYTKLMLGTTEISGEPILLTNHVKSYVAGEADDELHAIRLKDAQEMIGWITMQHDPKGRPDIGISLAKEYQNLGYGSEAFMLFCNRLHDDYGLTRIYIRIHDSNYQSLAASRKLGAVLDKSVPDEDLRKFFEELYEKFYSDEPKEEYMKGKVPNILYFHIDLPCKIQKR